MIKKNDVHRKILGNKPPMGIRICNKKDEIEKFPWGTLRTFLENIDPQAVSMCEDEISERIVVIKNLEDTQATCFETTGVEEKKPPKGRIIFGEEALREAERIEKIHAGNLAEGRNTRAIINMMMVKSIIGESNVDSE